jgi:predicted AlkP superfamily pyrophosphatase or phosphodiesterase
MIQYFLILFLFFGGEHVQASPAKAEHVILISFDGLRPDAITSLGKEKASAFYQMMEEGAYTLNARTDYDFTVTLPNHACMITGYPVYGMKGHRLTENTLINESMHEIAGHRIYSIFDVLHQNHRHSAMLASKLKFDIYKKSFPIDIVSLTDLDDQKTLENFHTLVREGLPDFVFIHFSGTDRVGHKKGWDITPGSPYMKELQELNQDLKDILNKVSSDLQLKNSTIIIVTTDHGGQGLNHSDKTDSRDFTIPLIIWGKHVAKGVDLYRINADRRKDPLNKRIPYTPKEQPIRNGDAANLSLSLLGLPPVPGSSIGYKKPLKISQDPN